MTLDATQPLDQEFDSMLPYWIRQTRAALNALIAPPPVTPASEGFGITALAVVAGSTFLTIGATEDLQDVGLEIIVVTGVGASVIASILGGNQGQVKVFIFQDTNTSFADSITKINGTFYLNQLPSAVDFDPHADDIIALVNIGGDGATVDGYWKEVFRTLSVK